MKAPRKISLSNTIQLSLVAWCYLPLCTGIINNYLPRIDVLTTPQLNSKHNPVNNPNKSNTKFVSTWRTMKNKDIETDLLQGLKDTLLKKNGLLMNINDYLESDDSSDNEDYQDDIGFSDWSDPDDDLAITNKPEYNVNELMELDGSDQDNASNSEVESD